MIINQMKCPEHRHRNVYKICSILCGLPKNLICSKCLFFIGPMPVNLDRSSISDIYKKEHIILEKSDGIRYLLFGNNQNFSLHNQKDFWFDQTKPILMDLEALDR